MNKVMSLVMALIFAVVLSAVVGFVISSINGSDYAFGSAVPYGLALGLILYVFGNLIVADQK